MTLQEEPKIERALTRLIDMLEQEVQKALFITRASELDAQVVEEAEQSLAKPNMLEVQEHTTNVREKVRRALREWLEWPAT